MQHRKIVLAATERGETRKAATNEAEQLCRLVSLGRLTPEQALDLIEITPHDREALARYFGDNRAAQGILAAALQFRGLVKSEFFKRLEKSRKKKGDGNGHALAGFSNGTRRV